MVIGSYAHECIFFDIFLNVVLQTMGSSTQSIMRGWKRERKNFYTNEIFSLPNGKLRILTFFYLIFFIVNSDIYCYKAYQILIYTVKRDTNQPLHLFYVQWNEEHLNVLNLKFMDGIHLGFYRPNESCSTNKKKCFFYLTLHV